MNESLQDIVEVETIAAKTIPNDWEDVKLGSLINYKKGVAFKSRDYRLKGIPIVKVSNFTQDSIELKKCIFLEPERVNDYPKVELNFGDIIIATVGSWPNNPESIVGKVVKVKNFNKVLLLNQNAVRLRSNGSILQLFLYYRLKNKDFF